MSGGGTLFPICLVTFWWILSRTFFSRSSERPSPDEATGDQLHAILLSKNVFPDVTIDSRSTLVPSSLYNSQVQRGGAHEAQQGSCVDWRHCRRSSLDGLEFSDRHEDESAVHGDAERGNVPETTAVLVLCRAVDSAVIHHVDFVVAPLCVEPRDRRRGAADGDQDRNDCRLLRWRSNELRHGNMEPDTADASAGMDARNVDWRDPGNAGRWLAV